MQLLSQTSGPVSKAGTMLNAWGLCKSSPEVRGKGNFLCMLPPHPFTFLLSIILVIINYINTTVPTHPRVCVRVLYTQLQTTEKHHSGKVIACFLMFSEEGTILSLKETIFMILHLKSVDIIHTR